MSTPLSPGAGPRDFLGIVRRQWALVVLAVVLAVAAALALTAVRAQTYRAEASIVIAQKNAAANPATVATMADLVRSDIVARNVIDRLHLTGVSPGTVLDRLHISVEHDSSVIRIGVDWTDTTRATQIAQELSLIFPQLVRERFGTQLQASVFDPPHVLPGTSSPHPAHDVALGAVLGLGVGLLLALLRDGRGGRPRSRAELEQALGAPVVAERGDPDAAIAALGSRRIPVLGVAGDGAPEFAAALARAFGRAGSRPALVDASGSCNPGDGDPFELVRSEAGGLGATLDGLTARFAQIVAVGDADELAPCVDGYLVVVGPKGLDPVRAAALRGPLLVGVVLA